MRFAIASVLAALGLSSGTARAVDLPAGWEALGPVPEESLASPVDFLTDPPTIDGRLDAHLAALPARSFTALARTRPELRAPRASFRLAYGAGFFYLFVETEGDSLTARDRAFQNGDGLHLVIARPTADGTPSREFHVVAAGVVDRPEREWMRRFIWYQNVDRIFLDLGEGSRFAAAAGGRRLGFELLLPWSELPPHHPWLGPIGFNLAFVHAVGETDKLDYQLLSDSRLQSEQQPRRWLPLRFAPPSASTPSDAPLTFVRLELAHPPRGAPLNFQVTSFCRDGGEDSVGVRLLSGEGTLVAFRRFDVPCRRQPAVTERAIDLGDAPVGGYRVRWESRRGVGRGELPLTILPSDGIAGLAARVAALPDSIPEGTRRTLAFELAESHSKLAALYPTEPAGGLRIALERMAEATVRANSGEDPFAHPRGVVRRAFRSSLDGSLQPYTVRLPKGHDEAGPAVRWPVVLYLHGSGVDEWSLPAEGQLSPGNAIELAPRARGTSHAFSTPQAQADLADALADTLATYRGDPGRVVVAGFSMGGYGVLRTLWEQGDRFRGGAVFAGHPDLARRWSGEDHHPSFLEPEALARLAGRELWIYHGDRDRNCPTELAERMVAGLQNAGARVELLRGVGRGHEMPGGDALSSYHAWLARILRLGDDAVAVAPSPREVRRFRKLNSTSGADGVATGATPVDPATMSSIRRAAPASP